MSRKKSNFQSYTAFNMVNEIQLRIYDEIILYIEVIDQCDLQINITMKMLLW